MRSAVLIVLLVAFVVAGVWIAASTVAEFRLASDAADWPTTPGTITRSEVRGTSNRRRLELRYVYEVDGRRFTGHRATFRGGLFRYRTRERAQLYTKGKVVAVRFLPTDPSVSVLETGVFWPGVLFQALAAVAAIGVGAGGLYLKLR